jgi:two-component system OmpR family response regulator
VDPPSYTVLVVDDDTAIRFLCRVNLELEGWTVREAAAIDEARSMLAAGGIDLVLLDVHVGGESGVDFLGELRAVHPDVSVVLLTGSVGTPALDGVEADGVIAKPFTLTELTGTVRKLAPRIARGAG